VTKIKTRVGALLAMLALVLAGALTTASPAQAVSLLDAGKGATAAAVEVGGAVLFAPGCTAAGFCLHDTSTSNPYFFSSGSAPRNTCISSGSPLASFATENTGVQWWLFRTGSCGGSHIAVHANVNLDLTNISGWNNAVVAVERTSTVG
jgi:hypothetical protein